MKPRTKLQKEVAELSEKLGEISESPKIGRKNICLLALRINVRMNFGVQNVVRCG